MRRPLGAVLLAVSIPMLAQPLHQGDLLLSGFVPTGQTVTGKVVVYNDAGVFQRELSSLLNVDYGGTLLDPRGYIWVGRNEQVVQLDDAGGLLRSSAALGGPLYFSRTAIGTMLVGTSGGTVYLLDPNALIIRQINAISHAGGIDLATDRCTLYYGHLSSVVRYDVCRNQDLGTLVSLPISLSGVNAVRLLPDGSLLVIDFNTVTHLSATGTTVRTYPYSGDALALDVDGTSFWVGMGPSLSKIDINTGQVLLGPVNTAFTIRAISVVGEPRAGVSPAALAAVPAVSTTLLLLLVVGMGAMGLVRLAQ